VDSRTLLIQGRNRQWYKATLFSPCFNLTTAAAVGFKTNASGSFDKFGSIVVRRQRCHLTSLVAIPPPANTPKVHKAAEAPPPAAADSPQPPH